MQAAVELAVNGRTLRGMVHQPTDFAGRCPIAVLYHGFTGQKTEARFVFVRLSRALAAAGVASVRFDFYGSGESDGDFGEMTLGGEVEEAKAILDFARGLPFADPSRSFLIGLSMGGAVASVVAGDEPAKVRALVLWAPAGNMPAIIAERVNEAAAEALRREGRVDIGGHWLGREFIDDLAGIDIYGRAARYAGMGVEKGSSREASAVVTEPAPRAKAHGYQVEGPSLCLGPESGIRSSHGGLSPDSRGVHPAVAGGADEAPAPTMTPMRYPGRVLILHGDADPTVPLAASERYAAVYGHRAELHVIAGADHTFNRKDWEEEVIRRTVGFLREESGA